LADLLVAGRPIRGAHIDRRTGVLDLKVIRLRTDLGYAYLVLGVTDVSHHLGAHDVIEVVARAGRNVVGLIHISALGVLLEVLEGVTATEE
jgi:hypothetical protein